MSDGPIRIVVIKGSVRPGNYTSMAAALVIDELGKNAKVSVEVVDPRELKLPPPGLDGDSADAARLKETVSQATGVILATPSITELSAA